MKRKIVILVVVTLLLASTAGFASAQSSGNNAVLAFEKSDITDATVTASVLNIRQGPSADYPVICKADKDQTLKIIGKVGDWYAVYCLKDGCIGAVDGKYLAFDNSALTASAKLAGDSKNVTPSKAEPSKVTPSKATPSKATPSKTTPAKETPAKETPSKQTPSKETPSKATPSKTPASKTTSSNTEVSQNVETVAAADISKDEQKLLDLVNKARKDAGVDLLTMDANLLKVARLKAGDMADNGYFSHQSPTYGSPFDMMRQFENTFKTAGENIAGNKTVDGAFQAWMSSDSHKKNILNNSFNITGIGIVTSQTYGKIIVQQFIGR